MHYAQATALPALRQLVSDMQLCTSGEVLLAASLRNSRAAYTKLSQADELPSRLVEVVAASGGKEIPNPKSTFDKLNVIPEPAQLCATAWVGSILDEDLQRRWTIGSTHCDASTDNLPELENAKTVFSQLHDCCQQGNYWVVGECVNKSFGLQREQCMLCVSFVLLVIFCRVIRQLLRICWNSLFKTMRVS